MLSGRHRLAVLSKNKLRALIITQQKTQFCLVQGQNWSLNTVQFDLIEFLRSQLLFTGQSHGLVQMCPVSHLSGTPATLDSLQSLYKSTTDNMYSRQKSQTFEKLQLRQRVQ